MAQTATQSVDFEHFIDHQLKRAEGRIKTIDVSTALVRLAAAWLFYLLVVVGLDHALILTSAVRFTLLIVAIGGSAIYLGIAMGFPVLRRLNRFFAAYTIERSSPEFHNSVINFLSLRKRADLPRPVLETLEEQAVADLSAVEIEEKIDSDRLVKSSYWLALAVAIVCAGVVFNALVNHRSLTDSLARALFPTMNVLPPTKTRLLDLQPGTATVIAGTDVEVSVVTEGKRPNRVTLFWSPEKEDYWLEQDLGEPQGILDPWEVTLPLVEESFEYYVVGGDSRSDTHRITVNAAPMVESVEVHYQFPAYTGWEPFTSSNGNIDALIGTRVTLTATTNRPVRRGAMRLGKDKSTQWQMRRVAGAENQLTHSFTVEKDERYVIWFETEQGDSNPHSPFYQIKARRDLDPNVSIRKPGGDLVDPAIPSNAVVPIEIEASDDFGVEHLRLVVVRDKEQLMDLDLIDGRIAAKQTRSVYPLDLAKLYVEAGEEIRYWAVAEDNHDPVGKTAKSNEFRIRIGTPQTEEQRQEQIADAEKQAEEKTEGSQQPGENPTETEDPEPVQPEQPGDSPEQQQQDEKILDEIKDYFEQKDQQQQENPSEQPQEENSGEQTPSENNSEQSNEGSKQQPSDEGSESNETDPENEPGDKANESTEEGTKPEDGSNDPKEQPGNDEEPKNSEGPDEPGSEQKPETPKNNESSGGGSEGQKDEDKPEGSDPKDSGGKQGTGQEKSSDSDQGKEPSSGGDEKPGDKPGKLDDSKDGTTGDKEMTRPGEKSSEPTGEDKSKEDDADGTDGSKSPDPKDGTSPEKEESDPKPDGSKGDKPGSKNTEENPGGNPLKDPKTGDKEKTESPSEQPTDGTKPADDPKDRPQETESGAEPKPGTKPTETPDGTDNKQPRPNPDQPNPKTDKPGEGNENQNPDEASAPNENDPNKQDSSKDASKEPAKDSANENPSDQGEQKDQGAQKDQGEGGKPGDKESSTGAEPSEEPGDKESSKNDSPSTGKNSDSNSTSEDPNDGSSKPDGGENKNEPGDSESGKPGEKPSDKSNGPSKNVSQGGMKDDSSNRDENGKATGGENPNRGTAQAESEEGVEKPELTPENRSVAPTDLTLQRLNDQINKRKVDPALLKRLGWTEKELEQFVRRFQGPGKAEGTRDRLPGATKQGAPGRTTLKNRNVSSISRSSSTGSSDEVGGNIDSGRIEPPSDFRDIVDAFNRSRTTRPRSRK